MRKMLKGFFLRSYSRARNRSPSSNYGNSARTRTPPPKKKKEEKARVALFFVCVFVSVCKSVLSFSFLKIAVLAQVIFSFCSLYFFSCCVFGPEKERKVGTTFITTIVLSP